jgi:hypothetical protein
MEKKTGYIYLIYYIGQRNIPTYQFIDSTFQDIKRRFNEHKRIVKGDSKQHKYHHCEWAKIGLESLTFQLLEEVKVNDRYELREKEKPWIDKFKPGLNEEPKEQVGGKKQLYVEQVFEKSYLEKLEEDVAFSLKIWSGFKEYSAEECLQMQKHQYPYNQYKKLELIKKMQNSKDLDEFTDEERKMYENSKKMIKEVRRVPVDDVETVGKEV